MKLKLLGLTLLIALGANLYAQTTITVAASEADYTTIQAAINASTAGDIVEVADGTYNESITVNQEITLQSVNGAASTTISGTGSDVITISADNVLIDGFTITNPSGKHGIYAQDHSGITISNNILDDIGSTDITASGTNFGIAIISSSSNVNNVMIEDNIITNISGGSGKKSVDGIAMGWSNGTFNISNVTVQNNLISDLVPSSTINWGMNGIIINHASGSAGNTGETTNLNILNNTIDNLSGEWVHGIGLEGLTPSAVVQGNTFSNFTSGKTYDNYGVFFESNSYIGTVSIKQNIFNTSGGIGIHSNLLSTLTTEVVDATENWWGNSSGPSGTDLDGSGAEFGTDVSNVSIAVHVDYSPWLGATVGTTPMTWYTNDDIQDAIDASSSGDSINVAAGTYNETLNIDKSLIIRGATASINKNGYTVPSNYNWDDGIESIINHPNPAGGYTTIINIEDVDYVTFEGFVVQELNAVGNLNTSLIRVYAHTKAITDITLRNNVIGPNTNIVSQDGTHGRMGLYIVNHPYNNLGVVNSTFSGNKIFDCKGNGNNIFLWSSYYSYGAPGPASMSGTVIEDNEIYGAHRSGIESAGGYSGLTIRNNKIYDNNDLPGDDPDALKYGNGIILIRGTGDNSSNGFGPVNLTIENNEIYNNSKNGIYTGPVNEDYTITNNDIHDNGWDGIQIDLECHYHNANFAPIPGPFSVYDASTNININDNDIYDNTLYGARVYGTPTNGFTVDAKNNWWGDPSGPFHSTNNPSATGDKVTDYVDYSPWIGNSSDDPHDTNNLWTYYVDGSNPDAINDIINNPGLVEGDTIVVNGGTYTALVIDKKIVLKGTNGAVIQHGSPAITISANNVVVDGFTFTFDSADYAIFVSGDYSGIVVRNCTFNNTDGGGSNPGYGIDNNNGGPYYVDATINNDWGDPSGPTHSSNLGGSGVTITDYVIYKVQLVYPGNLATDFLLSDSLKWYQVPGATSYSIQISKNSNFSSPVDEAFGITDTFYVSDSLDYFTKYYWRVRAVQNTDSSSFSSAWRFRTIDNYTPTLFFPADSSTAIPNSSVSLGWGLISRSDYATFLFPKFKLVYDTDENFGDSPVTVTGIALTTYYIGLDPGITYYWKIITVKNNIDVAESETFEFTTSGAVVKPIIAYPKDETTVYSNTPIFYWYSTGFNSIHEYEIEWSTSASALSPDGEPSGSLIVTSKTGIPGLFTYPDELTGGEHYYWHVRTIIGTTVSDWSDVADFYTFNAIDASIPVPAYPTGGVEVYSKFPKLYWVLNGPNQGLTFDVEFGPSPFSFTGTPTSGYTGISQFYVTLFSGISGGTSYDWKVRSNNGSTPSTWSDAATFSVYDFSADLIPILSWPIGGNTVYSTDVNFAWHVEGPSLGLTYDLKYGTDLAQVTAGVGATVVDSTGLDSNLKTVYGLTAGATYYWKVKVSTETTWSDVETFKVISGSGTTVPILNWPVGGATVWSTSQDLGWTLVGGGSPTFEVQVFTDAGLTTPFGSSPFTGVSDDSYTLTGLTAGATYYWRVKVEPSEPWSNVEVFTVFSGVSPAAPLAGSPTGGVELKSSKATLSWFSPAYMDHSVKYEVEYADNKAMTNSTVVGNLDSPSFEANDLKAGIYYWRSRSMNEDGTYSGYSDIANFQVTGVTGVEGEEGLPQNYKLSQNYPNPFNPSTVIRYDLPEATNVVLKIFNMLGQEVKTLVNEQANAGIYTVQWNGKDNFGHSVSSGAYIYQIVSGNFVQTRKMILLK